MKKWIQLIAIFSALSSSIVHAATLKNIFTTPAILKQPESVVYDSKNKRFFVSNIDGQPLDKDGHGFISILNEDGNVQKLDWVNGLNAPKGLCLTPSHLYVTDIDQFVTIDLKSRKMKKYPAPASKFLNDVTCNASGTAYVSDMFDQSVYIFDKGEFKLFLKDEKLAAPNGVTLQGDQLFVGLWGNPEKDFSTKVPGHIVSIDLKTKKISDFRSTDPIGNLDGLELIGSNTFIASDWISGKVYLIPEKGPITTLLSLPQGTADLTYIPEKKWVVIPHMSQNTLSVYELE